MRVGMRMWVRIMWYMIWSSHGFCEDVNEFTDFTTSKEFLDYRQITILFTEILGFRTLSIVRIFPK
jgi:hypothetical protein